MACARSASRGRRAPSLRLAAVGSAVVLAGPLCASSGAVPGSPIVALPEGATAGFVPQAVDSAGADVTFVNADPSSAHSVVSVDTVTERIPVPAACPKPKKPAKGKQAPKPKPCPPAYRTITKPLFSTGPVAPAGSVAILGTGALKPGSYAFFCGLHPGMKGTLVIQ